ncbi:Cleavage and polyadenylation specificity factor subunit 1, partial [Fragariocoptes setiger]
MYSICKTTHPSTCVEHSIYCHFYDMNEKNLIVAGANQLQVYRLIKIQPPSKSGQNHLLTATSPSTQLTKETPTTIDNNNYNDNIKLECLQSFELYGNIACVQSVQLETDCQRDSLILSFYDAKLSIVEYDPATHDLRTLSLHYFEDDVMRDGYTNQYSSEPKVRIDPEGRCAAMLVYGRHIIVVPFYRDSVMQEGVDLGADTSMTRANISADDDTLVNADSMNGSALNRTMSNQSIYNTSQNLSSHQQMYQAQQHQTPARSPVMASYKLDLSKESCGEKIDNIVDIQFLQSYNEPTLVILYEPNRTWSGRIAVRQDTFLMVALSLNTSQRLQPIIWTVNNLPYDCRRILPVPKPIGGVVVIGVNELIYLNQSVPNYGVALNSFTKDSTSFPLHKQDSVNVSLDLSIATFISSSKLVIMTKDGEIYVVTLFNDGMRCIRNFRFDKADLMCVEQPSTVTVCEQNFLFIGSQVGDSMLLRFYEKHPLMASNINAYASSATPTSNNFEGHHQYHHHNFMMSTIGDSHLACTYEFQLCDTLINVSPCVQMRYGEDSSVSETLPHDAREPHLELVTASGYGRNGSVCVFHRSVKPQVASTFELGNSVDFWTVEARCDPKEKAKNNGGDSNISNKNNASDDTGNNRSTTEDDLDDLYADPEYQADRELEPMSSTQLDNSNVDTKPRLAPDGSVLDDKSEVVPSHAIGETNKDEQEAVEQEARLSYVILSRDKSSMVFTASVNELKEVIDNVEYDLFAPTILAANIGKHKLAVQVTTNAVRLLDGLVQLQEIRLDTSGCEIVRASVAGSHLVLLSRPSQSATSSQSTLLAVASDGSDGSTSPMLTITHLELVVDDDFDPNEPTAGTVRLKMTSPELTNNLSDSSNIAAVCMYTDTSGLFRTYSIAQITGESQESVPQLELKAKIEDLITNRQPPQPPKPPTLTIIKSEPLDEPMDASQAQAQQPELVQPALPVMKIEDIKVEDDIDDDELYENSNATFTPAVAAVKRKAPMFETDELDDMDDIYGPSTTLDSEVRPGLSDALSSGLSAYSNGTIAPSGGASQLGMGSMGPGAPVIKDPTAGLHECRDDITLTNWLLVAHESGVLEILSVPEFRCVYLVKNLPAAQRVLVDSVQLFAAADVSSRVAYGDDEPPKIKEILLNGMGLYGSRPTLFVRLTNELLVYETFPLIDSISMPPIDGHLMVRFKKFKTIQLTLIHAADAPLHSSSSGAALSSDRAADKADRDRQERARAREEKRVRELDQRKWLRSFERIGRYRGVFLAGTSPHWFIMTHKGNLRCHEMLLDGAVAAFSTFNEPHVCQDGFMYLNEHNELRMATLNAALDYDNAWTMRKVIMGETVHFVNYHVERRIYCVVTSRPVECKKLVKVGSGDTDGKHIEPLERDPDYLAPLDDRFTLHLYDPQAWERVPDAEIELDEWEHVTSLKNVMLTCEGTSSGLKGYIAMSTNYCYGEDVSNRGRIWILDLIEVVPEPDKPLTRNKIKKVYCQEQKGPVTALCHVCGLLLSVVGQKIYLWQLKEDQLVGIAFIDTQIYIHCAMSVKNLILISDIRKSILLYRYQQDTRTLSLVARDPRRLEVFSCEFAIDNRLLNFVISDAERNLIVYAHAPLLRESHGGEWLLRRADFHLGAHVNAFCRMRARHCTDLLQRPNHVRHITMYCTLNGGVGYLLPIPEKTYRRLLMLQNDLTMALAHVAGLNPRAWRTIKQSRRRNLTNPSRNIIDGDLIYRFSELSFAEKRDMTRKIGTTSERVLADLQAINQATAYF